MSHSRLAGQSSAASFSVVPESLSCKWLSLNKCFGFFFKNSILLPKTQISQKVPQIPCFAVGALLPGKVYVSHIVDYLRHTTSRSSGDSGLDELCNMLDPEHKDVSIDLDTYHAVMREWIDDCRSVRYLCGEKRKKKVTSQSVTEFRQRLEKKKK